MVARPRVHKGLRGLSLRLVLVLLRLELDREGLTDLMLLLKLMLWLSLWLRL